MKKIFSFFCLIFCLMVALVSCKQVPPPSEPFDTPQRSSRETEKAPVLKESPPVSLPPSLPTAPPSVETRQSPPALPETAPSTLPSVVESQPQTQPESIPSW